MGLACGELEDSFYTVVGAMAAGREGGRESRPVGRRRPKPLQQLSELVVEATRQHVGRRVGGGAAENARRGVGRQQLEEELDHDDSLAGAGRAKDDVRREPAISDNLA